jgi:hypothetical protein
MHRFSASMLLGVIQSIDNHAWEGNRTPTPLAGLRILSPVRLPVPPPRLTFKVYSLPKRTTLVKIIKSEVLKHCPLGHSPMACATTSTACYTD